MRNLLFIAVLFFLNSCALDKAGYFAGKQYSVPQNQLGMLGDCKIYFINDSLAQWSFNGGNTKSLAYWQLIDEDQIQLAYIPEEKAAKFKLDFDFTYTFYGSTDSAIKIKNRNTLYLNGLKNKRLVVPNNKRQDL